MGYDGTLKFDTSINTQGFQNGVDKIGSVGKTALGVFAGNLMSAAVSKLVEFGKYALESGMQFEAGMSQVEAISGASASDMEKLTAKASEMGRKTKFSATESAEAFKYMAMAGWKTKDMLNGIEGVMNLAAASGENLGTVSDIVTDAMTALGYAADGTTEVVSNGVKKSVSNTTHFADVLASASSNSNTNVSMMGETFKYAAAMAGTLGYSAEDVALATGLMANNGIKASMAGTSLNSIMTRLSANTNGARDQIENLGVEFFNSDGSARSLTTVIDELRDATKNMTDEEKANFANKVAGLTAQKGFLAMLNAEQSDYDKLSDAINNCDGSAQRMAETMQDNLAGKVTIFKSALEGLADQLYTYISEPAQWLVEKATNAINSITDAITPQKTELQEFLDEIKRSNEEVERTLDNADKTVRGGESREAEIAGYKEIMTDILDNCKQFNRVDLSDGKFQIVNAAGEIVAEGFKNIDQALEETNGNLEDFAPTGIGTEVIRQTVDEITGEDAGCLGYISKTADEVESELVNFAPEGINYSKISEGTTAIVTCFNETGDKVDWFKGKIDETGQIKANFENIEDPTNAVITVLNNAGEAVGTFETTIEGTGDVTIDLSHAEDGVGDFIEYIEGTDGTIEYFQTNLSETGDGFDVSGATGSVDDIITYYDENGNEITEFRKSIEKTGESFDTQGVVVSLNQVKQAGEEVIHITDSYAKFQMNTIVEALADSVDGLAEAWNNETGELSASEDELLSWLDTAQQAAMQTALQDAMTDLYSSRANALIDVAKANAAVTRALDDYNAAAGTTFKTYEEWEAGCDGMAGSYGDLEDAIFDAKDTQDACNETLAKANTEYAETNQALQNLKPVIEESSEDIKNEGYAAEQAAQQNQNLAVSTDELTDKQKEALDSYKGLFGVTDEGLAGLQNKLEMSSKNFADWCSDRVKETQQLIDEYDKLVQKVQDGMNSFINALDMSGEEGTEKIDNMITNLEKKQADLQTWVDNMTILGQMAGNGFSQELYDSLLADGPEKSAEKVQVLIDSLNAQDGKFKQVSDLYADSLDISRNDAELLAGYSSTGKAMNDSLANGLLQDTNVTKNAAEDVVQEAADSANSQADAFEDAGEKATDETASAIEDTEKVVKEASEGMVSTAADSAGQMTTEFLVAGEKVPQEFKKGIEMPIALAYAEKGAKKLIDTAIGVLEDNMSQFTDSGTKSVNMFTKGLNESADTVREAANTIGMNLKNALSMDETTYYNSGYNSIIGLANGMNGAAGEAYNAAQAIGTNLVNTLKATLGIASPSKVFASEVGAWIPPGIGTGIENAMPALLTATGKEMESLAKRMSFAVNMETGRMNFDKAATAAYNAQKAFGTAFDVKSPVVNLNGTIHSVIELDGETVAENQTPFIDSNMAAIGIHKERGG